MRRSRILSVLNSGSTLVNFPFRVHFREGEGEIAISVPKRSFKRAVKRNLLRRRIREACRLHIGECPGAEKFDMLIIYLSKEIEEYKVIESNVAALLKKIGGMASDKAD